MAGSHKINSVHIMIIISGMALFGWTGCWEPDSQYPTKADQMCDGQAPPADVQAGICEGAQKICAQDADGAWGWHEPDYATIPGYEATEVTCDGLDNDCDSVIDNGVTSDFYPDLDGDTYGDATAEPVPACTAPASHVADHTDCDDGDDAIHPGAAERCNGIDDNCDTTADEGFALGVQCGATDVGPCEYGLTVCSADGLGTECLGNIDPEDETCDGLDNDCDSVIDNGVTTNYYPDLDGDTYGDAAAEPVTACSAPAGHVADHTDCDDGDDAIHPGAAELCDSLDNDCDTLADEDFALGVQCGSSDVGECAYGTTVCTADGSGTECLGNTEPVPELCDGLDNDCVGGIDNGVTTNYYPDLDGDNYGDASAAPVAACSPPTNHVTDHTDCDDGDDAIHPGAAERCNGLDDNCNTAVDEDFALGVQCGSTDVGECAFGSTVCTADGSGTECSGDVPPEVELCDGLDNDCDNVIDNGVTTNYYPDTDDDGFGDALAAPVPACSAPLGHVSNNLDCDDTRDDVFPGAAELCDGLDNDCDSIVDEDLTELAWYPDLDGDNYGDALAAPVMNCANPGGLLLDHTDCNDADGAIHPGAAELCDGLDNDCNAIIDDGLTRPLCLKQDGVCAGARQTCGGVAGWLECDDAAYLAWNAAFESVEATCDGLNNDCDAQTDEGVKTNYYPDLDGDNYGDASAAPVAACSPPANHVTDHTDCNDVDGAIHPGAPDLCDGVDNDCNPATADGSAEPTLGLACDGTDADLCNEGT
ncbi:MAG: hypothetical protein CVU59_06900, partial [Deltaproteobacteria bacterium HGW-Deltaproteobacteria-17]